MQPIRILIDKDNTVYDLHGPWLKFYNADNSEAPITKDMLTTWEMSYDIYKYLDFPEVYSAGSIIDDSVDVTKIWAVKGYELAFVTSITRPIAATTGLQWLSHNFPHIPNVFMMAGGHNKHWLSGDFLIDDGLHNHDHFEGISIVFDQPWNRDSDLIRAYSWQDVRQIVDIGVILLESGYTHDRVQKILRKVQREEIL